MEIRNRMPDIVKLRCNACQDFLKMIIKSNWQKELYSIAKGAIERDEYADNYRPAFEKMRDIGIENYCVDDMDVTFITQVVCFCPSLVRVKKPTQEALKRLRDDRNLTNHSNENEEEEELYLRGLLALCDLKIFVKTVDKYEKMIDDKVKLEYRRKYMPQIEMLMNTLDEERIALIQREKEITKDINRILECTDNKVRQKIWCDIYKLYDDKYLRIEKDYGHYSEFIVKASDAGIEEAHKFAVIHFEFQKNYPEALRRCQMLLNSKEELYPNDAQEVVRIINYYVSGGNEFAVEISGLVDSIIKKGYPVIVDEKGTYILKKRGLGR